MLIGRESETAEIDRLLAAAHDGSSGVLVVRGVAGVGKSALLQYAADRAEGMTVLRGTGIESESEFAFAGLHQLFWPVLDRIESLPSPQAAALRAAFALSTESVGDRFRVALGALGLLSDVAEERPLLCVVDDVQWLDRPSSEALLFTARRLHAEGVVMLFGLRDGEGETLDLGALPQLPVGALDEEAAAEVVAHAHGLVAPAVVGRLVEQARGNALALVELPAALSREQLDGRAPLPEPLPLTHDVEHVFLARVASLPSATQHMLRLAAADDAGSLLHIARAAEAEGVAADALAAAEVAGLVSVVGETVVFRHPLVRSAIYQGASSEERRAAHRALADAWSGELEADRRAWHRASAAIGRDAAIADELESTADRARLRGGHAAAASALERAAELSVDGDSTARRLVEAGDAAWKAGQPARALTLLDRAAPLVHDVRLHAVSDHIRGLAELSCGSLLRAGEILIDGAVSVADTDPQKAFEMLVDAGSVAGRSGDAARTAQVGRLVAALPPSGEHADAVLTDLLVGVGGLIEGKTAEHVPLIVEALGPSANFDDTRLLSWAAIGAATVGDVDAERVLLRRALALARASGAVDTLVLILETLVSSSLLAGRFNVEAEAREGLRLARDSGLLNGRAFHLSSLAYIAAVEGRDEECRAYAAEACDIARVSGFASANTVAEWAVATLDLSLGRPDATTRRLVPLMSAPRGVLQPFFVLYFVADVVEAFVRSGKADEARGAFAPLESFVQAGAPPWANALAARCRALLADDADAVDAYEEVLRLQALVDRPFDDARTHLLYGEHLRRARQRSSAREHLRQASDLFEQLRAASWAERAQLELRATGETVRRRDVSALEELTPQELQIARLVGEGRSNKDVAAQLYLSPRTVEYHLRKVFMKLGIASRSELIRAGYGEAEPALT